MELNDLMIDYQDRVFDLHYRILDNPCMDCRRPYMEGIRMVTMIRSQLFRSVRKGMSKEVEIIPSINMLVELLDSMLDNFIPCKTHDYSIN